MTGSMRWVQHSAIRAARRTTAIAKGNARGLADIGLFWSIATALVVGVLLAVGMEWVLRRFIATSTAPAAPIDITKLSLTIVAGVGGVVALVVAYRRQRDLEQGRFVERFGAAAAQLGATDVAVRIAGVYAMAGVADESRRLRRQQCIDVLCGYLRLPYAPDLGGNHQSKSVRRRRGRGGVGEHEDYFEFRQNDREVRTAIVRVIAARVRPTAEFSWSACDFDFRAAYLEDAYFGTSIFSGTARFSNARFTGTAGFSGATFSGTAWFDGVTFSSDADFDRATFLDAARFDGATFSDTARFSHTKFSSAAWFTEATFGDTAGFSDARFSGTAGFGGTTFSGPAEFSGVTYYGDAWYGDTRFADTTRFGGTTFSSTAWFSDARFTGPTRFGGARFAADAWFGHTSFSGPTSFENVDFGTELVSFANPRQWGPPEPVFDWSTDLSRKPRNVKPDNWLPATETFAAPVR
ncbi:pentapeptide repeat-containing protein [Nocardia sp. NPDC004068]|uniref:pentapeptide repeat-containing protein n=1 Tax=Nocardia sp. NPDC004068 TaxID=3364303 RepID=UPI0036B022E9